MLLTDINLFSSAFLFFDGNHFDNMEMLLIKDNIKDSIAFFDFPTGLFE